MTKNNRFCCTVPEIDEADASMTYTRSNQPHKNLIVVEPTTSACPIVKRSFIYAQDNNTNAIDRRRYEARHLSFLNDGA
jgi:hypothetical protein